jgi:hypothetical protein
MRALDGRIKRLDRRLGRCLGCPACGMPLDEQRRQMVIESCREPKEAILRKIMELLRITPIEDVESNRELERRPNCPVCKKQIGEERRKMVVEACREQMSPEARDREVAEIVRRIFGERTQEREP